MNTTGWTAVLALLGLAVITVVTRSFFFMFDREVPLPPALKAGLRYAPLAALMAIVAPEVVLRDGQWLSTWQDPRLWATVVAVGWFAWRRSILGTIVSGSLTLVALNLWWMG